MSIGASASDSCSEIGYYYYDADGGDHFDQSPAPGSILCDPEYVEYSCLDQQQVEDLFDKIVKELIESIPQNNLKPELAKLLLHLNKWDVEQVRICLMNDSKQFLIENEQFCFELTNSSPLLHLDCGHGFCKSCWQMHIETQLQNGVSSHITCMNTNCSLICQKDFVLDLLKNQPCEIILKYEQTLFHDFVSSHPYLRLCLGSDCDKIIFCNTSKAHRVICSNFFKCGSDYHAPASCEIIKKWLVKCADDSETANYIRF
uniref:RBR-type E3 ubiquitin transferase n=1 Tax=Meloidogyne incognita TaxID=6306 RepID=A0A914NX70_MELIC